MKVIDETTLLAYVDGKLAVDESEQIELLLSEDAQARELLVSLRSLPETLPEAFDALLDRPVPEHLRNLTVASSPQVAGGGRARQRMSMVAAIVAALSIGIAGGWWGKAERGKMAADASEWVELVASYQAPYSRETVNRPDATDHEIGVTEKRLGKHLGLALTVPRLGDQGLAFKRGQLLEIDGRPLAQLVYLPRAGKPIAYCIFPTGGPDRAPQSGRLQGLGIVQWQRGGFGHVVVGDAAPEMLSSLARRIQTGA